MYSFFSNFKNFFIRYCFCAILVFFIKIFFQFNFFYQIYSVVGHSMLPTLTNNTLFVRKYLTIKRGDICIYYYKYIDGNICKRVIALEGDRVQMIFGKLYINGKAVQMEKNKKGGYYL